MRPAPQPERDRSGYLNEDTIAALITAAGGPVAVVRVSGPEALTTLRELTNTQTERPPRRMERVALMDRSGRIFDDSLVAVFPSPDSFTGEHCVEYHVHGGSYTLTQLMSCLREMGVRSALPGEFSFRAVRNGKMTLSQAEALADLIASSSEGAARLALEKLSGSQGRLISDLAERLKHLATLGEVGIDFSDQDVDEVSLPVLRNQLDRVIDPLRDLAASFQRGSMLQHGIGVAFIGLPNAGKSSFFNALLGEDRSIVSDMPGTTRDLVREKLTLEGDHSSITLRLEDTAGLRRTSDHIESIGIDRTLKAAREADLVVLVVDSSRLSQERSALMEQWEAIGRPSGRTVGVLTKADLIQAEPSIEDLEADLGVTAWARTSALTGQGISEAASLIARKGETWVTRGDGEVLLTRFEHQTAVNEAVTHLERAIRATEIDLFASDLRHALQALSPLIGNTLPDDILGRIFSKFCIGK